MSSDFLQFPNWDPIAISIGPLDVHWYGLMYLVGAAFAYWWGNKRADAIQGWQREEWQDLLFWGFMALILGGRLGYFLFYQSASFFSDPLMFFRFSQGGMSFHGGLLGVIVAMFIFAIKKNRGFLRVGDFVAPLVPVGLGAGRIGNFINGELWGRVTDVPWAMVFPNPASGLVPRHPSQLYQAATEGLLLFLLLWAFSRKPRPVGAISGLFLLGYGCARMTTEFFREPDAHLGILGVMSMGQWLSLPMILGGIALILLAYQGKFGGMQPLPVKNSESGAADKNAATKTASKKRATGKKKK